MDIYTPHGRLVIARHGESEWNALSKWTGTTDVGLTEKGTREAQAMGVTIRDIPLSRAYYSEQRRTKLTLDKILHAKGESNIPVIMTGAINERDYGKLTGKNKWDAKRELGEDEFNSVRRGWSHPIPGGETLRQVYNRVVPYFKAEILPRLTEGENILMVAHGNSIRSLVKYLENISDEGIADVEMIFGRILIYHVDKSGRARSKQIRIIDSKLPPA